MTEVGTVAVGLFQAVEVATGITPPPQWSDTSLKAASSDTLAGVDTHTFLSVTRCSRRRREPGSSRSKTDVKKTRLVDK